MHLEVYTFDIGREQPERERELSKSSFLFVCKYYSFISYARERKMYAL